METCGYMVKCWDYQKRACLRPRGHEEDGNPHRHNPFSNSVPPGETIVNVIKKPAKGIDKYLDDNELVERDLVEVA